MHSKVIGLPFVNPVFAGVLLRTIGNNFKLWELGNSVCILLEFPMLVRGGQSLLLSYL